MLSLLVILVAGNCIGNQFLLLTEAHGLGEEFLMTHDTSEGQELNDTLFLASQKDRNLLDNDEFISSIKAIKIDLVAPNKQLRDMMNTISTKCRSMFFENYDYYFKELNIGSTSRPMLYTYLGLKFATEEQISSWYSQQRKRIQNRIVDGCQSLASERAEILSKLDKMQKDFLDKINNTLDLDRLYMAHKIQNNNLNLFMLENYLLLCSRLEPESAQTDHLMI